MWRVDLEPTGRGPFVVLMVGCISCACVQSVGKVKRKKNLEYVPSGCARKKKKTSVEIVKCLCDLAQL